MNLRRVLLTCPSTPMKNLTKTDGLSGDDRCSMDESHETRSLGSPRSSLSGEDDGRSRDEGDMMAGVQPPRSPYGLRHRWSFGISFLLGHAFPWESSEREGGGERENDS